MFGDIGLHRKNLKCKKKFTPRFFQPCSVPEMTYNVSSGTLNPTIPYNTTFRRYNEIKKWVTWPDHDPFSVDLSSAGLDLLLSTWLTNLKSLSPPTTKIWKRIQNFENGVVSGSQSLRGHSRSLKIVPSDTVNMSSYLRSKVTLHRFWDIARYWWKLWMAYSYKKHIQNSTSGWSSSSIVTAKRFSVSTTVCSWRFQ